MEIEFNEYELKSKINDFSDRVKKGIKDFFNSIEVQALLNNNRFEHIYRLFKNNSGGIRIRCLTEIFLLSGIDILHNLEVIPEECFMGLPITKLVIPHNIIKIEEGAFAFCRHIEEVIYEGSLEEWDKLATADFIRDLTDSPYLNKIICNDGVINLDDIQSTI